MTGAPTAAEVSVIVPVRDGADHLGGALDSLLDQDPPPGEITVIDGGSRDASVEVAASRPGVRVAMQRGTGLAAARNQAVEATTGPVVAFCDADDRWTPEALDARLAPLADPACGAVIGQVRPEALVGEVVPDHRLAGLGRPRPGYTPGALLVRRPVLVEIGPFDETLTVGTDADWFVRLVSSSVRLDVLEAIVLVKGLRPRSLSADIATYRAELVRVARAYIAHRRGAAP